MAELNPYAPPSTDEAAPKRARRTKKWRGRDDVTEALAALDAHLARPESVAEDLRAAGGRLRPITIGFLAVSAAFVTAFVIVPDEGGSHLTVILLALGGVLGLVGLLAAWMDLSLVPRGAGSTPALSLRSYLRSLPLGRFGYAWACLAPTARAQTVHAPDLGLVVPGMGEHSMRTPEGLKRYAATFCRPQGGYMRSLQVKRIAVQQEDGDVAIVSADLVFQSWPRWANIVMGVGVATGLRVGQTSASAAAAPIQIVGIAAAIAGLVGLLVLRKKHEVTVYRTLLRGRNGAWYVFDPDLLEGSR